jgi:hypothetical protein
MEAHAWSAFRLTGCVDVIALRGAFDVLFGRGAGGFALAILDLSGEPRSNGNDAEAVVRTVLAEESLSLLEAGSDPVPRGWLVRIGPHDHMLSLVLDRGAPALVDLPVVYEAVRRGQPVPAPGEPDIAYWRTRLAGAPPLELPTDRSRSSGLPVTTATYGLEVPVPASRDVVLAAFVALLGRYAGQDDVVVGVQVGNARLPLRVEISADMDFRRLLDRTRAELAAATAHNSIDFSQLVEKLRVAGDGSRHPLFQVLFDDAADVWWNDDLHVAIVPTPNGTAELDLVLRLGAAAQRPHAELSYRSDLFDETTIHRFAGDLTALLAAASAPPSLRGERRSNTIVGNRARTRPRGSHSRSGVERVGADLVSMFEDLPG